MTADELKIIADLTLNLTKLRQNDCAWLCIENFSPELFSKLLTVYTTLKADSESINNAVALFWDKDFEPFFVWNQDGYLTPCPDITDAVKTLLKKANFDTTSDLGTNHEN